LKIGVIVPQGWTQEYAGWQSVDAWARTRDLASQVEALGFESVWLFDHFHTVPRPTEEITFEAFTTLAALAPETRRVRLGHLVLCAAYRNPALTAKMISTMDVITDGAWSLASAPGGNATNGAPTDMAFPMLRNGSRFSKISLKSSAR
jgi:alkanesulfonate monooxygenase SsuD/methylene tetrahydromethanopterin reductase-like flavin-dependent oxidoreductase (luciferase family)